VAVQSTKAISQTEQDGREVNVDCMYNVIIKSHYELYQFVPKCMMTLYDLEVSFLW